jgi:sulfate/thiosulfate transport system ATP-binding protein
VGIVARGLRKSFGRGGGAAVDDVSFEIGHGELVALLGPSGGGKTTVLRILAGLEAPDEGRVLLRDVDVTDVRVQERNIGFVFQSYALFRHMTVHDNVAFGLSIRRRPREEVGRAVQELLSLVRLEGLGGRFPHELSGGQRQRVALARALAPGPSVLLLDEPFGALDAKVRLELREWLRRLHEQRAITTVFVTHDQEEALSVADRVIVMNGGRVEQIGTPDEIYDRPATEFVAGFVGSINELKGEVRGGRADLGPLAVHAPPGAGEGTSVRAFIRPHDVVVGVEGAAGGGSSDEVATARVERLVRVGWMVRLDLRLRDEQPLTVELTKDRVAELGVVEGDRVYVNLRDAKLFVQDYSI